MKPNIFSTMLATCCLAACVHLQTVRRPDHAVDFVNEVKPLLEASCLECHHRRYVCAGLNLETKTLAMKGGRSGPVIIPGVPHDSMLYNVLLLGHDNPVAMPPTPDRLKREHERILHDWIQQGAPWPAEIRLVPPQDWQNTDS